ncbi:hypothetical protein BDV96DRAFT_595937 [Lophiotrema nucula]|uniref:Uncharacterized protein n=1 Tax=Lophiotrema nucula TaxID=690887 RepID=A0A6A5ZNF9_9PLEO|nr:hypothetical protein BDV96DRAFT_595937 [Lophiotrema nucula]
MSAGIFDTSGINGGKPLWGIDHFGEILADLKKAQLNDPQPRDFDTYQEIKEVHRDHEVHIDETYRISIAKRCLTSSTLQNADRLQDDANIIGQLKEKLEIEEKKWERSNVAKAVTDHADVNISEGVILNHAFEIFQGAVVEKMDPYVLGKRLKTIAFLGFDSPQDENAKMSMTNLVFAEKLFGALRGKGTEEPFKNGLIFEDTSYTPLDMVFIQNHFSREESVKVFVTNYGQGIYPCKDFLGQLAQNDGWENTMYVIAPGARQPYRQMVADLMLDRIKFGRLIPLAVICASADDNDDENECLLARNPSSDRVKKWLDNYTDRVPLYTEPKTRLKNLCLYTRPKGPGRYEEPVEDRVKTVGVDHYEYTAEPNYDGFLNYSPFPAKTEDSPLSSEKVLPSS